MFEITEPRIFITVQREIDGHPTCVIKEVSFVVWQQARNPGGIVEIEVNAALRDIGYV